MPIKPSPLTYTYLFDHALSQEIGIAFIISGVPRKNFVNELGKARQMAGNPEYKDLIIFQPAPPHENEIFICKKSVSLDDATPLG
jgi:hypothetical protein